MLMCPAQPWSYVAGYHFVVNPENCLSLLILTLLNDLLPALLISCI